MPTKTKTYSNGQSVVADIPLPYDGAAERAIIGCILTEPDGLYTVSPFLRAQDFYLGRWATLYRGLLRLSMARQEIDPLTLEDAIEDDDHTNWPEVISDALSYVPSPWALMDYARIVEKHATRRRLIRAAGQIATLAYDTDGELPGQMAEAETLLFGVRGQRQQQQVQAPREYAGDYLALIEQLRDGGAELAGLETGFTDLDRLLGGIKRPHQYVLAARPGMGKSAFVLNLARHLAIEGQRKVAMFSLEMSHEQIMHRLVASMTGIDSKIVQAPWKQDDGQVAKVYKATGQISEGGLYVDATPGQTPAAIRSKCLQLQGRHGLDLVIVDHLHIMRADRDLRNSNLEYGEMTRSLAALYKTLGVPGITVAQLNRGVESRQNKRPMLSDLRESGRIEEDAYAVLFLFREDYYEESERPNVAEVIVAKNRDGTTGAVDLFWQAHSVSFKPLSRQAIDF